MLPQFPGTQRLPKDLEVQRRGAEMLVLSLSLNTEIASNLCTLKTTTETLIWQKHTCIWMCQVLEASLWVAQVQIKYKYTSKASGAIPEWHH